MKKLLPFLLCCLLFLVPFTLSSAQVSQRTVSVSAVIPPTASSYQLAFASDGQTTVAQRAILTYTITYGVQNGIDLDAPITIVARFDDDLAPDGSHVTSYVTNSASSAYGGATPVVDLVNRTITWTIPHLPEGTLNQTLNFQLQTTENYAGLSPVDFTTHVTMSNQYVTLPEKTTTQTYQFDSALVTPTPTPTPGPTATPGPGATATPGPPQPTPTSTPDQFHITGVSLNEISSNTATVGISTNQAARSYLRYGTTPQSLRSVTAPSSYSLYATSSMTDLTPVTRYYFQVVSIDATGTTAVSEIYTFTTAKQALQTVSGKSAISLTSNGTVLASGLLSDTDQGNLFALITTNTHYQLTDTFSTPPTFRSSEVVIRSVSGEEQIVHVNAQSDLLFTASLQTHGSGLFTILLRKTDANGNIHEQKIGLLKVMQPLSVVDKDSHQPIGDARIRLSVYNAAHGAFEEVPDGFFSGIKNPSFTNASGEIPLLLPQGRYQVEVSALGYRSASVVFTLGSENGQEFPVISLQHDLFDMTSLMSFLRDWFTDMWHGVSKITSTALHSSRFFTIVGAGATSAFVLLSYLLFSIRTQIKLSHVIPFLFFFVAFARNKHKETYLSGIITTQDKKPLSGVRIDVIDAKTHTILTHTETTGAGTFHLRNHFERTIVLFLVSKDGYAPSEIAIDTTTKDPITLVLKQHGESKPLVQSLRHVAGSLFEVSLLFSLVLELIFFATIGPVSALPFLAFSLLNIALWLFYLEEHTRI